MSNNYTILHCHSYISNAEEIWSDIAGFEGRYQISTFGRVKSFPNASHSNERILNPWKNHDGYLLVDLCKDGKVYHKRINKIVAETFIPTNDKGLDVSHKDENKENNMVDNLEWTSHKENCQTPIRNSKLNHKPYNEVMCNGIKYHSVLDCANKLDVKYKTMWLWLHGDVKMPIEWQRRGLKYVE